MIKPINDPAWKYTPAAKMKPGYLRQKFKLIRKQLKEQQK